MLLYRSLKFASVYILSSLFLFADNDNFYIFGDRAATFNSFGQIGLIQLPTAKTLGEGSIFFTVNKNKMYKYGALTVNPFDWMEASYFYYRPYDIYWGGPETRGQYLDKGFNVKFASYSNLFNTHFAIGLDDFAGTGFFSREYAIATKDFKYGSLTMGLGWGSFADENSYKNPLTYFFESFDVRSSQKAQFIYEVGRPTYSNWFRGPVSPIGGFELFLPFKKNVKLKVEYDPFDYKEGFSSNNAFGSEISLRKKDSNINLGLSFKLNDSLSLDLGFIKGNTFNFRFSFGGNFSNDIIQKDPVNLAIISSQNMNTRDSFYSSLLRNLNSNQIFLQSAELSIEDKKVSVAVASSRYSMKPIKQLAFAGEITAQTLSNASIDNIDFFSITQVNAGLELNEIILPIKYFDERQSKVTALLLRDIELNPGNGNEYLNEEFLPSIKFPIINHSFNPALVNHIGDPRQFYFGGLVFRLTSTVQLDRNLMITSIINADVVNNFDKKIDRPDSALPHVRTDLVKYLQQSANYLQRLQLDYFYSPKREFFGKFSFGILEDMYSGIGGEFLYKPFKKDFSVGIELYKVQKRGFERKFELLDYKTTTGHLNFNYFYPKFGILTSLSYGKYLARDTGYTLDLSRIMPSGFRAGFFFSRTNVSASEFGEGAFDKGFYFQIPFDLFLNYDRSNKINFQLRPLTRDGGQKLGQGADLIGIMHHSSRTEVLTNIYSFKDY